MGAATGGEVGPLARYGARREFASTGEATVTPVARIVRCSVNGLIVATTGAANGRSGLRGEEVND